VKIFISYRRDDSAGYAGRLFDYLSAHFGAQNVFMDIDTIEPGEDFRKVVSKAVGSCDVVLVMIGKQWLGMADTQGRRRLDDPRDFVRMEIGAALINQRVRVIPVLVRGAGMPGEHELPEGLKELTWRNAIELSDSRFQHDAKKLISVIERIGVRPLGETRPPSRASANNSTRTLSRASIPFLIVALVAALFMVFRNASRAALPTSTLEVLSTATAVVLPTSTLPVTPPTPDAPTIEPSPAPTEVDIATQFVQLVDDYYMCINNARHDYREDYELCWDMLSDQPDEFQDYLIQNAGGKEAFINSWSQYRVSYALYSCVQQAEHFVQARYNYRRWDNPSQVLTEMGIMDYHFGLDPEGWTIIAGYVRTERGPYCEPQPRIDRLSLFQ
jgi:hypothetical protein